MPSKYRTQLAWTAEEAKEIEAFLNRINVEDSNKYFKDTILSIVREVKKDEEIEKEIAPELKFCIWKPNKITCPIMQAFPELKQVTTDGDKRRELVKDFCKICPILKSNSAQGQVNISPEASREWVKQTMQRPSSSAPLQAVDLNWTYDEKSAWFLCTFCFDTPSRFYTENPNELQRHLKDVHKTYQMVSLEAWKEAAK